MEQWSNGVLEYWSIGSEAFPGPKAVDVKKLAGLARWASLVYTDEKSSGIRLLDGTGAFSP